MSHVRALLASALLAASVAGCAAPTVDNPYPGGGGSMFNEPSERDMADARMAFDLQKLNTFRAGVSTKREVAVALGRPTWWRTDDSGYSRLGYDFHIAGARANTPGISPATFVFDVNNVLVDADYPESYKTWHIDRGPYSLAYVKVQAGYEQREIFLDGIVPADWVHASPDGTESLYLGGYVRSNIHVEDTLVGHVSQRNMVVRFTVTDMFIPPYPAYMLLSTDRFGTTRVLDWDTGPSLCKLDEAKMDGKPLVALLRELKSSSVCTKSD
jgi:hypothetical protein